MYVHFKQIQFLYNLNQIRKCANVILSQEAVLVHISVIVYFWSSQSYVSLGFNHEVFGKSSIGNQYLNFPRFM